MQHLIESIMTSPTLAPRPLLRGVTLWQQCTRALPWRVRAFNAAGYTAYSAAWTVTVQEIYRVFLPLIVE
jgi:hypothetical protein